MVSAPTIDADSYDLKEDVPEATPKHGTSIQAGWAAANALLKPKNDEYAEDFKFSTQAQLIRFLEDEPFASYPEHWIDAITTGKRSFVALETDDPFTIMLGSKPRAKVAWNVLVASDEEPTVKVLTAGPMLAKMLRAANADPKRGPLTKYYWAVSRLGNGPETSYVLDRVRVTDLAEEWDLDPEKLEALVAKAEKYDSSIITITPREEMLEIARKLKANEA